MDREQTFFALLVIVIAFILVSKYIAESTVRLIFQILLGAALLYFVLRTVGLFA